MPMLIAAPAFALRAHRRRQLEAQEVHRGGLLVVLALQIFVGDGAYTAFESLDLHPASVLDAFEPAELARGALRHREIRSGTSTFQLLPSGISGL